MSSTDITTDGLHKSAIIYRDNSARFVYVCFHCGCTFNEINETLQHIESHFQLANVVVEQSSLQDGEDDRLFDCSAMQSLSESVDVKIEVLDNKKFVMEDNRIMPKSDPLGNIQRKFRCKMCNLIHSSKMLVRLHALNIHIREPMKCHLCKKTFDRKYNFESHLTRHIEKGDVNWKSAVDGIKTRQKIDWSKYEAEVEPDNKVKVEKLQTIPSFEVATVEQSQPRDTKKRPYSRPYQCHKCPLKCRYAKALRTHFQTHHSDHELLDVSKCKECDGFYKNPFELRIHVLDVHRMITTFSCAACDLEFNHKESKQFEEHLEEHNNGPDDKKLWKCISEGINHPTDVDYSKYEAIYSLTEELNSCEFCAERFHLKCNLDMHMKSAHYGQRRLPCGQCDSIFTTPKVI